MPSSTELGLKMKRTNLKKMKQLTRPLASKICLIGKTGLLGGAFYEKLTQENLNFIAPDSKELNILDALNVEQFFHKNKDLSCIINCAAYTQVDQAEVDQKKCYDLNVEALKNLLQTKIPLIHFSSDYVFSAPPNIEIPEDFKRQASNVYGKSKIEAEKLLETTPQSIFWNIRTSWLFGPHGKSFIGTILNLSETMPKLKVIADQIGRPTYTIDLVESVYENFICHSQPQNQHYHLQNSGKSVSWAELAQKTLSILNKKNKIQKITSLEFNQKAPRPQNSCLKNTKIIAKLPNWEISLAQFLKKKII